MVFLVTMSAGFTPEMNAELEKLGLTLRFLPERESRIKDEYPCDDLDFSDVEGMLTFRFFCCNDLARFPALKFIQLTSHGTDHLPMDEIRSRGIRLCDARGAYGAPIAEFVLGGVLQLYKRAPLLAAQQREHVWIQRAGLRELAGQQVCIVGTGSLGRECAVRFRAMGCRTVGINRHGTVDAGYDAIHPLSALDCVLAESDIVILTLPLNDDSRGLFDANRFAKMKQDSVLVNVARGAIVQTDALLDALGSGHLSGAVIDVCETEPLPADSPLWDTENLILTPHNSFIGENNPQRLFDLAYQNIKDWIESIGGNNA